MVTLIAAPKRGRPRADITVDLTCMPSPYTVPALRPRDGRDPRVKDWLDTHPEWTTKRAELLRRIRRERPDTVCLVCKTGRHGPLAMAEQLAEAINEEAPGTARVKQHAHHAKRRPGRKPGLGTAHDKRRAALMRMHTDGTPCWWCGKPMWKDPEQNFDHMPLAADHEIARAYGGTVATRLLHGSCNSARGAGDRDDRRPATRPVRNSFTW